MSSCRGVEKDKLIAVLIGSLCLRHKGPPGTVTQSTRQKHQSKPVLFSSSLHLRGTPKAKSTCQSTCQSACQIYLSSAQPRQSALQPPESRCPCNVRRGKSRRKAMSPRPLPPPDMCLLERRRHKDPAHSPSA